MSFWDRFVLWVYLGLADTLPNGRDTIGRLFERAFQLGRLNPARHNDLSILLLLAGGRQGSPIHLTAQQEAARRGLVNRPQYVWGMLNVMRPSRFTELLELGRTRNPLTGSILLGVLANVPGHEILSNLTEFLSRLFLVPPEARTRRALELLTAAIRRYYAIPQGTVEFLPYLYQHVLLTLRIEDLAFPSIVPHGPDAAWFEAIEGDERDFIQSCVLHLPQQDVVILYLHFYARLTAEQIACIYQHADSTWTANRVVDRVEAAWDVILQ